MVDGAGVGMGGRGGGEMGDFVDLNFHSQRGVHKGLRAKPALSFSDLSRVTGRGGTGGRKVS